MFLKKIFRKKATIEQVELPERNEYETMLDTPYGLNAVKRGRYLFAAARLSNNEDLLNKLRAIYDEETDEAFIRGIQSLQ